MVFSATNTAAAQGNPFETDAAAIRAGRDLFGHGCADCHGPDAKGNTGPDLTQIWARGGTDARVFTTIRTGVEGSIMPASFAAEDEIWAVVAYLRDISTVPPFENPTGDAERGRILFAQKCSNCHRVGNAGGVVGPDLANIALVRSREALVSALSSPSENIAAKYRSAVLETSEHGRVEGVIKSEDVFSIQIMDTTGRLRAFLKTELNEISKSSDSLMPKFSPEEMDPGSFDDVLAYLSTLRADTRLEGQ